MFLENPHPLAFRKSIKETVVIFGFPKTLMHYMSKLSVELEKKWSPKSNNQQKK